MHKSTARALFVASLCLFVAVHAESQEKKMYSWVDENGTVHFSETRPAGQDVVEKSIPQDAAPASGSPYQANGTAPSLADQRREEIARKSAEKQVSQAAIGQQCATWQAELDRIEPNRRVFYTNNQGETVRMDDVERTNRVAELKSQIAGNCR